MGHGIQFGGRHRPSAAITGSSAAVPDSTNPKYTRVEYPFPEPPEPLDLDALSRRSFEEEMMQWLAKVWVPRHPVPSDDQLRSFDWLQLEKEFRRDYAGGAWRQMMPGATAKEIWVAIQLKTREPWVWLISREQPQQLSDSEIRKEVFDARDLVWLLATLCLEFRIAEPSLPMATYDGKTGHVVTLAGLNPYEFEHPTGCVAPRGWFSFLDPWPARSLLAAGRNAAGIAAIEDYPREPLWLISPRDLAKVIFGTYIPCRLRESIERDIEAVRAMEADRASRNGVFPDPPWESDSRPFETLLKLAGGTTGCEVVCAKGQLEWAIRRRDAAAVEHWRSALAGMPR